MMFKKKTISTISVIALVALVSLTGCSKKTPGLNDTPAPTETVETQAPEVALDFGSPLDLGNGIKVTVSTPEAFTPGAYASNYVKGQVANRFAIDISNGGTAEFDVTQFVITSSTDGTSCVDVLDGDNAIMGAPTDPLAAGTDVTFNYAIACSAKVGAPLKISVSVGDTLIALNGTLK
ncbi:MAG: hypothetical protein F2814_06920 [Actinobacteria bacterium]|nr:hypothetical protein [Actinomycetota bacterium]